MRGGYLALEGVEGAGKSTVADLLAEELRQSGREVTLVREPGATRLGEGIRRLLLHSEGEMAPWAEALLFAAQRAQLAVEVVGPALASGRWVVSDRCYYSSLAYQGGGRGLGVEEVRMVNEAGLGDVLPDLVVVLDIDVEQGLARQVIADRIGGEGLAFQRLVADTYRRLAANEPARLGLVDASAPVETVVKRVRTMVEERLGW
ncbi:MAG: dTMP kinase [Acidimicrobiia bacterium]